jgi:uncharacterized protein YjbJ (UPF0337 family)
VSVRQRTPALKHHYVRQRTELNDNLALFCPGQHRPNQSKETALNKNQVEGAAKDIGGKIQEEVGKLVGNSAQQIKGVAAQLEGNLQKQIGKLQEGAVEIQKP